ACCQSSRWHYHLLEVDTDAELHLYYHNTHLTPFAITPKHLKLIQSIPQIIQLPIHSLKIHPPIKSIHYIPTLLSLYPKLIH
uniref:U32 family peptidase n=1 Tax=Staphylococcus epidermidis TaxID=1282 RepID=UPI001642966C